MQSLPPVETSLPQNNPASIRSFWIKYWLVFFAFLPWMFIRQGWIICKQALGTLGSWNKSIDLLDGHLKVLYLNSVKSFFASAIMGERFLTVSTQQALIDPGPPFGLKRVLKWMDESEASPILIVATHEHEEHIGNIADIARIFNLPTYASAITLHAIQEPEKLSFMRRTIIGQTRAASDIELRDIATHNPLTLTPIISDGHCKGHVSFYDSAHKVLYAGDSFLHEIFTSPNKDVNSSDWLETLERYLEYDIETMIGSHGYVTTMNDNIPDIPFIVERKDPNQMIRNKLAFTKWAMNIVAEGEKRGLPYDVIEASLFPWNRTWSWKNWFVDESARLLTGGEFSRTHFVRSLTAYPDKVPRRFFKFLGKP